MLLGALPLKPSQEERSSGRTDQHGCGAQAQPGTRPAGPAVGLGAGRAAAPARLRAEGGPGRPWGLGALRGEGRATFLADAGVLTSDFPCSAGGGARPGGRSPAGGRRAGRPWPRAEGPAPGCAESRRPELGAGSAGHAATFPSQPRAPLSHVGAGLGTKNSPRLGRRGCLQARPALRPASSFAPKLESLRGVPSPPECGVLCQCQATPQPCTLSPEVIVIPQGKKPATEPAGAWATPACGGPPHSEARSLFPWEKRPPGQCLSWPPRANPRMSRTRGWSFLGAGGSQMQIFVSQTPTKACSQPGAGPRECLLGPRGPATAGHTRSPQHSVPPTPAHLQVACPLPRTWGHRWCFGCSHTGKKVPDTCPRRECVQDPWGRARSISGKEKHVLQQPALPPGSGLLRKPAGSSTPSGMSPGRVGTTVT